MGFLYGASLQVEVTFTYDPIYCLSSKCYEQHLLLPVIVHLETFFETVQVFSCRHEIWCLSQVGL